MGLNKTAVDFGGTDFVALAGAMGGHGVLATDRDALRVAVEKARSRNGFTLIACPIGASAYDGRI
jgi:acetolactate synthase-1/2/3 large subunit